jgi:arylsulfatase A-like enzyme
MPWWEYTLHKWYLEFKSSRGAHFAVSEKAKLKEYQALLKTRFDELGYPPGDIAIRTNDWKLIFRKNRDLYEKVSWENFITGKNKRVEEIELYDLRNDPLETTNVAGSNQKVVARLKEKLLKWDESVEKQKVEYFKGDKRWIIPYP